MVKTHRYRVALSLQNYSRLLRRMRHMRRMRRGNHGIRAWDHLLREQEAGGSNPLAPTTRNSRSTNGLQLLLDRLSGPSNRAESGYRCTTAADRRASA